MVIKSFEDDVLYGTFLGKNIFEIYYTNVNVLTRIIKWLDEYELNPEIDERCIMIENQYLRRIYTTL